MIVKSLLKLWNQLNLWHKSSQRESTW